jgi:hypothetical protein
MSPFYLNFVSLRRATAANNCRPLFNRALLKTKEILITAKPRKIQSVFYEHKRSAI